MAYKSTSLSPITLVFSHRPRYIRQFLWKKFWGAPPKITPISSTFQKNRQLKKHVFSPLTEISDIGFWKKAQKRRFLGSPTSKIVFDKLSIKKLRYTKNFGRDPPHRHFMAYFRKSVFEILIFFHIFSREITTKFCSFSTKNLLFRGFLGKSLKKSEKWKSENWFFEKRP